MGCDTLSLAKNGRTVFRLSSESGTLDESQLRHSDA
jgi:hypothetical protein